MPMQMFLAIFKWPLYVFNKHLREGLALKIIVRTASAGKIRNGPSNEHVDMEQ